jgi:hypothetical protein
MKFFLRSTVGETAELFSHADSGKETVLKKERTLSGLTVDLYVNFHN